MFDLATPAKKATRGAHVGSEYEVVRLPSGRLNARWRATVLPPIIRKHLERE